MATHVGHPTETTKRGAAHNSTLRSIVERCSVLPAGCNTGAGGTSSEILVSNGGGSGAAISKTLVRDGAGLNWRASWFDPVRRRRCWFTGLPAARRSATGARRSTAGARPSATGARDSGAASRRSSAGARHSPSGSRRSSPDVGHAFAGSELFPNWIRNSGVERSSPGRAWSCGPEAYA